MSSVDIEVKQFTDKRDMYAYVREVFPGLLSGDAVADLANASALLNMFLEKVNWVGFYIMKDGALVLGPFQGKPAVVRIEAGAGVCGTAVAEGCTQVVDDVHKCENHIACDANSSSEIVVPMFVDGRVVGVLDLDSPVPSRFDAEDREGIERFAAEVARLVRPGS
ncbi:MAG: GAF domain-containing protein [Synergistaceae bacterium]|jgi:GAF domain-containing protein|nr:GAF domain-containing protein [Synergistaceae bacterium]